MTKPTSVAKTVLLTLLIVAGCEKWDMNAVLEHDTEENEPYLDQMTDDIGVWDTENCSDDIGCPPSMFCDPSTFQCHPDTCTAGETHCEDDDVMECLPNGSGWLKLFTCQSESHYTSVCSEWSETTAGCNCEDDWNCPAGTMCEEGVCTGTGLAPACSLPPQPFQNVLPTAEIEWGGSDRAHPDAEGSPFPKSSQTVMAPLVINLDDDNQDGIIDEQDFPEIVFATFSGSQYAENGVLRAIHGGGSAKGRDFFAVCGNQLWKEGDPLALSCSESEADLNATASLAAGDLDGDGVPEIVAIGEDPKGRIYIYSNEGHIISRSKYLNWGYTNPAITLANIDNKGYSEIIVGRHVLTLKKDETGRLNIADTFKGNLAQGIQGDGGPVTCVADLTGDERHEIVAGTTVYRLPNPPPGVQSRAECQSPFGNEEESAFCNGELLVVWDGYKANNEFPHPKIEREGFCAIADVLGQDQEAAPGPDNPLDGQAEVITISNGYLQIFNGTDGRLLRRIDLGGGQNGGAPNVDDFDGDGFPEIGSAFQSSYIMMDLQEATDSCPEWAHPFVDSKEGLQGNPPRTGKCLHNSWRRKTEDASSGVTGSSVFDFNGDGSAEVVYNDECYFRVYDGATGEVLFKENSPSRTLIEYPVVADVDNDGNAEIVFGASNESGNCSEGNDFNNGLEVWGDANDMWVSARRIWNQHSYHITNVLESGSIPFFEPRSWTQHHERIYNSYRSNPRSRGAAPDITITGMQLSTPDVTCGERIEYLDITVRVENKGDLRIGPGVVIGFYGEWRIPPLQETEQLTADNNGTPLTSVISKTLDPGETVFLSARYEAAHSKFGAIPNKIQAIVDDGNKERECREDNNSIKRDVDHGEALADITVELGEFDFSTCPVPKVKTTITNMGSAPFGDILLKYFANGFAPIHTKLIKGPLLGSGGSITFWEPLPNFPTDKRVLIGAGVQPAIWGPECSTSNNSYVNDEWVSCTGVVY